MMKYIMASFRILDVCAIPINDFQISIMLKAVKQSLDAEVYNNLTVDMLAGATLHSMLTIGLITKDADLTAEGQELVADFIKLHSEESRVLDLEKLSENLNKRNN